jgi:hypothetical protein
MYLYIISYSINKSYKLYKQIQKYANKMTIPKKENMQF